MNRLIDDLRTQRTLNVPEPFVARTKLHDWMTYSSSLYSILKAPDLICLIHGISILYFQSPQEFWDLENRSHFQDLTPPRPAMWFEYPFPGRINSSVMGNHDLDLPDGRAGVLLLRVDPTKAVGEDIPSNAKWILHADIFLDYGLESRPEIQGPHCPHFFAIDDAGAIIGRFTMQTFAEPQDSARLEAIRSLITWIHPALLALSWIPRELPDDQTEISL